MSIDALTLVLLLYRVCHETPIYTSTPTVRSAYYAVCQTQGYLALLGLN